MLDLICRSSASSIWFGRRHSPLIEAYRAPWSSGCSGSLRRPAIGSLAEEGKMPSKVQIHAVDHIPFPDQFDRLPDSLVLLILNKVSDVRSLGRCCAVSKRFNALVPYVQDIYLKIDRVVAGDGDGDEGLSPSAGKPSNFFCNFLKYVIFAILRPLHHLRSAACGYKPLLPQFSHHSPARVLKNFGHVRNLRIELPAGDVGTEDGVLLKWRAEFGSTLQNCVILGGTRMDRRASESPAPEDNGSIPEAFYTDGGLKLRVVWTISSLIAASTRHYLLRQIIKDHPTLRSLILTDADGQGTLCMGQEQLKEFREKPLAASASSNRTQVPASLLKLRYASQLLLPDGISMQGATLVAIRPSLEGGAAAASAAAASAGRKEAESFVSGAFEEPFGAAVKALFKRRIYLLEMNSF